MIERTGFFIPDTSEIIFSEGDKLHTFFFPVLHTLDHEVGTAFGLGQDRYHRDRTGAYEP